MKISEALQIVRGADPVGVDPQTIHLVCGFTPLLLQTFLSAGVKVRLGACPKIETGLYGDLAGNLERAASRPAATVVVVEWSDLDPRLGARGTGGRKPSQAADILVESARQLARLAAGVAKAALESVVVVTGPTLPMAHLGHTTSGQAGALELDLHAQISAFLAGLAVFPNVRVVNGRRLAERSPETQRFDVKMELTAGFPYRWAHADALGDAICDLLYPPAPKKGLITDLDDTLWQGILGEVGAENVAWDAASNGLAHGMYQQALASLAEQGVLLAIASKNESAIVSEALRRPDLLIAPDAFFPVEAHWEPKSQSVARILKAWNIGAEGVVFVDDSPMELAEVSAAHPGIVCLPFPPDNPEKVWPLLATLQDLFGRPALGDEDRLRTASLRAVTSLALERNGKAAPEFLSGLDGTVTIDFRLDAADRRAFELINKTNQFNLNGVRVTEASWRDKLSRRGAFLVRVSYQDKLGALGKIAVLSGIQDGLTVEVDTWVMSCRAFSRRIEYHTLDRILSHLRAERAIFAFKPTDRNDLTRQFLTSIGNVGATGYLEVTAQAFRSASHLLPHQVAEIGE